MSSDEWFRRTSWTDADRLEFNARLKHAREDNRPQYLRIQAHHLATAGNHDGALELLDQFLAIDDGGMDLAPAQLQRAESFVATGNQSEGIAAFRAALDAERKRPNVQTEAWLLFPWFVIESQITELYSEVAQVLAEFAPVRDLTFPISKYRFHALNSLLSLHNGENATAKAHANRAMEASMATQSGFRYHAKLGLVEDRTTSIHERISEIAAK